MRNRFLSLLLLFVFALDAVGQQGASTTQPSVDRLRADITYLAADKLDGRRTGTEGANQASRYIAGEFKRAGIKASSNGYMQSFPYEAGVKLGEGNRLTLKPSSGNSPNTLRAGDDWMPLGFSSNGDVENAKLVYVKHGITAKEQNHDDYANVDVKDKIAIALDGTPDGDNPHGQFTRYSDARWKAIAAKDKGAKALVLVSQAERFGDDKLSGLRYDNAGEAGLPVIAIAKSASIRFFGENYINLKDEVSWSLSIDIVRNKVPAANVIGILEGSDPTLKNESIVIGAHYDHLGRGGEGSLAPRAGDIHHGADDNASGVAAMLELARMFARKEMRPKRTLVFIAFSGEEEGLLGSNYYVNHPVLPLAHTVAMINMDMIGRLKDNRLIIGGVGTSGQWREIIDSANQNKVAVIVSAGRSPQPFGLTTTFELTLNEDGYGPSDHSSFYSKQIPVLFFWTGTHEDYHKPSDTAEKINYEGEVRVISMVSNVVRAIDRNKQRPVYTVAKSQSTGRTMGFKVSLGTIPNYAESNDGLMLDGVREASPAAKAGLMAGDVIVKLAGRAIKNVYDYTYALGEMKAGDEYEVEVMRTGQLLKLKIIPDARK